MLLSVDILAKSIGTKDLFSGLSFTLEAGEKAAIIGRNGVGKTTLFNILSGLDTDFYGEVHLRRGTRLLSTAQEHHNLSGESAVDYILQNLPDYKKLKHILDTYPATMGDDMRKIAVYSEALERFTSLNYYDIEKTALRCLLSFQITEPMARAPMQNLSGGQKRFVELARVELSDPDIALIDEPTNHMDYVAKAAFIEWLKAAKSSVVVISHDRDVLQHVSRIIELKDGQAFSFKGNYRAYLKQNAANTAANMNSYEVGQQTLNNLHKQILWARARKPGWHGKGEKNPYDVMERRLQKQHDELSAKLQKPSFWLDRESAANVNKKVQEKYTKYKAKNIRINPDKLQEGAHELLNVDQLQLGYGPSPLFKPVSFSLRHGGRLQLIGRNGAGKTTLVKAIAATAEGQLPATWQSGSIFCSSKLRLSVYEQEIGPDLLNLTLPEAIEQIYLAKSQPMTRQQALAIMGNYLFSAAEDSKTTVAKLSGGQKARLQIINMLANNPNLLILDEPTNHLDLPSIEELENALGKYGGAVIYVSHDSYFAKNLGGEQIELSALPK